MDIPPPLLVTHPIYNPLWLLLQIMESPTEALLGTYSLTTPLNRTILNIPTSPSSRDSNKVNEGQPNMHPNTHRQIQKQQHLKKILFFLSLCFTTNSVSAGPIEDLKPGYWLEIPNTNMSAVYPSPTPPGNSGPASVMSAWAGGAYDTKRDRLIVWGGGHYDYAGNELYAFNVNSLTWERITEPSNPAPDCENYMPDGQPGTSHTYNTLQYIRQTDSFIRIAGGGWGVCPDKSKGDAFQDGKARLTDIYNFSTNSWERGAKQPPSGNYVGKITAIDLATGHIWSHGTYGGKLIEYNPFNDSWKVHSKNNSYLEIYGSAAIDHIRRIMVSVGEYSPTKRAIRVWDLKNPGKSYRPETSGDTTLEYAKNIGFVFDPVIEKFVGWVDGSSLYTLDPETWVWSKIDAAPDNTVVPSAEPRGTYGRFRYIPSKNAYILVNKTTENVYFYKLNNLPPLVVTPSNPSTPATKVNQL